MKESRRSLTLLRWTMSVRSGLPSDIRRVLHDDVRFLMVSPEFIGLGAEYHVGWYDNPPPVPEVRLALVVERTQVEKARSVVDAALQASMVCEIPDDRILAQDCDWYRQALQRMTDVALEVLASDGPPPIIEPDWSVRPPNQERFYADRLSPWLTRYSPTFRALDDQAVFWTEFFRWGPSRELSPPGHWLWNIADQLGRRGP